MVKAVITNPVFVFGIYALKGLRLPWDRYGDFRKVQSLEKVAYCCLEPRCFPLQTFNHRVFEIAVASTRGEVEQIPSEN